MTGRVPGPSGSAAARYWATMLRDPLAGFTALYRDFGTAVRVPYAPCRAFYLFSEPDLAEQVLVHQQDSFVKPFTYRPLQMVLGSGSLTSEGETWRRHRRLVQPVMAHRAFTAMDADMVAAATRRADTWTPGHVIDVSAEMRRLTLDVVGRVLFGTDFGASADRIGRALGAAQSTAVWGMVLPLPGSLATQRAVASRIPVLGRALTTLHGLAEQAIAERRRHPPPKEPRDLLDRLLAGHDGHQLDDDELRDEVVTLMLAGHETATTALCWTFMLLSQYPAARDRLESELDDVLAGRDPSAADIDDLTWTRAVISESMRLYPPAWSIERGAVADVDLGRVRLTDGDVVSVSPYLLHHNPSIWPNPEGFRPERFVPGTPGNDRPRYAYIPFGGGRRICVGAGFAQFEITLVLATLARSFRLDLMPGFRPRPTAEVTLHPRGPMPMLLTTRRTG